MVLKVCHVIERQFAQRHGSERADGTWGLLFVCRDLRNHETEQTIVRAPGLKKDKRGRLGVMLYADLGISVVAGRGEGFLVEGAGKSLVIVRCGVDEVAQNLKAGPLAGAVGFAPILVAEASARGGSR